MTFVGQSHCARMIAGNMIPVLPAHLTCLSGCRFWQTALEGVTVAGQALQGIEANAVVFDSGTESIVVPYDDFNTINEVSRACLLQV